MVPASYATPAVANDWGDRLVSRAMKYLGTPYRYGGTSPSTGFDCSGFVYYLYGAVFGQSIPRMPHDMAREGMPVARSDLKRGDLVFFGYRGTFTHVGIYAGNGQFVHATHRGSPVHGHAPGRRLLPRPLHDGGEAVPAVTSPLRSEDWRAMPDETALGSSHPYQATIF